MSNLIQVPIQTPLKANSYPYPVFQGIPLHGKIQLGLQLPTVVRSSVVRKALQEGFLDQIKHYLFLDSDQKRGTISEFLGWEATCSPKHVGDPDHPDHQDPSKNERFMPGSPTLQEDMLNRRYLADLAKQCATASGKKNPPLEQYVGTLIDGGVEYYCIGNGGLRFCYHAFSLVSKTDHKPLESVKYGNYSADLILICAGLVR